MYDNKRSAKRKWKNALIAAALTASMILALPAWSVGPAEAAPVTTTDPTAIKSTLTIERNGTTVKNQGAIKVDLYKVADAKPYVRNGQKYDAYEFVLPETGSPFSSLKTQLENAQKAENNTTEPKNDVSGNVLYNYNADYRALANEAAKIVFGNGSQVDVAESVTIAKDATNNSIKDLPAGLYLVIAHDETLPKEQYVKYIGEGENRQLITMAENNGYVYNYYPELISLPIRAMTDNAPQGIFSTAQSAGQWRDTAIVQLKAEEVAPMHDLTITKTITGVDPADIALSDAFVYQIDVYLGGRKIDSHVATISYNSTPREVKLEKAIPEGATLVITEVYTGASFSTTNSVLSNVGPGVDDNYTASFTNTYNGRPGGGAVVNGYKVDEDGNVADEVVQTPVAGTVVTQPTQQ